jgi:hypothetical protein
VFIKKRTQEELDDSEIFLSCYFIFYFLLHKILVSCVPPGFEGRADDSEIFSSMLLLFLFYYRRFLLIAFSFLFPFTTVSFQVFCFSVILVHDEELDELNQTKLCLSVILVHGEKPTHAEHVEGLWFRFRV